MTIGVYSGSFDPVTLGHLDIVRRSLKVFDKVIIAIGVNPNKLAMFPGEERAKLFAGAITNDPELQHQASRVQIKQTGRLLAEFAKAENANAIIRGVRTTGEYESEMLMGQLNKQLTGIETVFLVADPKLGAVSSSAVKEIAAFGGQIQSLVPANVALAMAAKANPQPKTKGSAKSAKRVLPR